MSRSTASRRPPGRPARGEDGPGVREALLEAARSLFAARDFRAVSLREIAAEAGVSPAMVHYYFGDKTGLFDALLDATFSGLLERLREA
ncbi:MAG: helix-turn-helix transcriptional regulator, partial [Deltaproteobacteria bacterium]|nr:helix-turn-helix transcriptional regulator [Deltaproteobacteria bacterium]